MPSAFAADGQIILGHLAIAEKRNEIPPARDPIATLGLTRRRFTLDAMQGKKNFENARETENHLLVQLKAI